MAKKSKWRRKNPGRHTRWHAVSAVFHEYCEMSSVHGFRFLGDPAVGNLAKMMWVVALVFCTVVLCCRTVRLSKKIEASPMEVKVLSTRTALEDVSYPSVIFCPTIQLAKGRAIELLVNYLETRSSSHNYSMQDPNVMLALNETYEVLIRYHYGMTRTMKPSLEKAESVLHNVLNDLDLDEFFIKASPSCEEMFDSCQWHGLEIDCCQELQRQVSILGLCFAFNSLVTDLRRNCTTKSPTDFGNNTNCFVRHSAVNGAFTGLTVALRKRTDNTLKITDGLMVAVKDPTSLPVLDDFHQITYKPGVLTQIAVTTVVTQTLEQIVNIPVESRECQFADEPYGDFKIDSIEKSYSVYNCKAICISSKFKEACGCRHHLVEPFLADGQGPVCNFSHLGCISDLSERTDIGRCTCKSRCEDFTFNSEIFHKKSENNSCVIDVFYWSGDGSLMYQRQLTIDMRAAIVSFGGLAGLLLGCSVLSMAELVYYLGRIVSAFLAPSQETIKTHPKKDLVFSKSSTSSIISTFPWNP